LSNTFFLLKSFLNYWLDSVNEHSLHSPFLFEFYTKVIKGTHHSDAIAKIEAIRNRLLIDHRSLQVEDLGAGSTHFKKNSERTVSDIARTSVNPQRYSNLYSRIIKEFNYQSIIELGTSVGLNTLYLGLSPSVRVTTFEGADNIAALAEELFKSMGHQNIRVIRGNIDDTLPVEINAMDVVDFALIDANHRYAPTMKYFDLLASKVNTKSIVVLDDIHSSPEMQRAWNEVRQDERVHATADLFRCGLVFFDPSLNKQHVVLRF
jgi:predicted O-methyltransferase YrrM